ncbi:uncharacterized protein LOC142982576 isoform X2 [Anticarsia gemmatalis]|uniref:uncharacterized protein LOC142982576 isoform X2 n=1 Tax=Anticarsia gemmatalis TaxID=129554 RepID=UPI003F768BB5
MSDLKICRVCLCKDVKMYHYNEYNLKQCYSEVLGQKSILERLPQYFCYTCAALLYKFHKFKQKCFTGQQILKTLLKNKSVTLKTLSQINNASNKLESPLDILTISKRVKTYTVIRKPDISEEQTQQEKQKIDQSTENEINLVNLVEDNYSEDEIMNFDEEYISCDDEKVNCDEEKTTCDKLKINIEEQNKDILEKLHNDWDNTFTESDDEKLIHKQDKNNIKTEDCTLPSMATIPNDNTDTNIPTESSKTKKKDSTKINKRKKQPVKSKSSVKTKSMYIKQKWKHLDPKFWLKITFTEEEAMDNFKAKANDPKYLSAAYRCDKCYKGFSTLDIYTRHMRMLHCETRGPLECRFCGKRFKKKFAMRPHMLVHYHRFQCLICKLVFNLESSAHVHNDVHSDVARECAHCGMKFRHTNTYYTHMRIYHRSEHVCSVCGTSFISAFGLNRHKRLKHFTEEYEPTKASENTYCERCDIKFETKQAFDEHFRESVKHADDYKMENNDQAKAPTSDVADVFPLPFKGRVNRGIARGKGKCATQCFVCGKNFASFYRYKQHHEAEHKGVPMQDVQICEICGATVKTIARHMNLHTKEKVYPCVICNMKFYSKSSLNRHQTHTGEKPYKCPLCEKRFTQKNSMQLHYRTFHLKEPYPKRKRAHKNGKDEGDLFEHFNPTKF